MATVKARATSSATVTSAWTNTPPASSAALSPAVTSTSTATTFAPSSANRRAVASPIPLPAPVTTAVRPSSLSIPAVSLDPFEVPAQLPVGHRRPVGGDLHPRHRRIVLDHILAECLGGERRRRPQRQRLVQRRGHSRHPRRRV